MQWLQQQQQGPPPPPLQGSVQQSSQPTAAAGGPRPDPDPYLSADHSGRSAPDPDLYFDDPLGLDPSATHQPLPTPLPPTASSWQQRSGVGSYSHSGGPGGGGYSHAPSSQLRQQLADTQAALAQATAGVRPQQQGGGEAQEQGGAMPQVGGSGGGVGQSGGAGVPYHAPGPPPSEYSSTSDLISSLVSRYTEAQSFLTSLRRK